MKEANKAQPAMAPALLPLGEISAGDIVSSFKNGVSDFISNPLLGLLFGSIYTIAGLLILASLTVLDMTWMIIPMAIGFPFIGPFIAVGLYEISRRRASGLPIKWSEIFNVILMQRERQFGLIAFAIMCIFWIWIFQVRLLLAVFLGFRSFPDIWQFVNIVTTTPEGIGFIVLGSFIGALLAFALFSITVISLPLLLEREIDAISAIIISVKTVLKSPLVMISWGVIVLAMILLAMLPYFLGIIIIFPILGHTTWHIYKKAEQNAA